ncbi:MAG: SixA phosphatase family protein [Alphaproteobacteria bacterium]
MQKNLYILRHAKAEAITHGGDDHVRPLAERGLREATQMGKYLMNQHLWPEKILCSTATRTRQTWLAIQDVLPQTIPIHYEEKLYHTSAPDIAQIIGAEPDNIAKLMVVGHNPGLHELCMRLAKDGDNKLRHQVAMRFPTCSFVELQFNGSWRDLNTADTSLVRFITPDSL